MEAKIKEIFSSIQGEGPFIGFKQLFIRFCNCNLKCAYCDTDYSIVKDKMDFSVRQLYDYVSTNYDLKSFHSVSLTGGEPLVSSKFLSEFLPLIKPYAKIYLETNATLYEKLDDVIDYVDIIAADIKLKSCSGQDVMNLHRKFFEKCQNKEVFAKVVFDSNITNDEINDIISLAKDYNLEVILQPKMLKNQLCASNIFCNVIVDKIAQKYSNVRLIPQVHKFLDIR